MITNYEDEPLANLLDYEPELFMGATSSEVGTIVLITSVLSFITLTITFLIIALKVEHMILVVVVTVIH